MTPTKTLAAFAAAGALIVAGCGSDDNKSSNSAAKATGNGADRAFVADMVPHHQAAIEMATIARSRAQGAFVKTLADNIIKTQAEEMKTMRREDAGLARAGIKLGSLGVPENMKGMDHNPATLKTTHPFDAAFMRMMVPHHQGALVMAKAELAKGTDPQLKTLAQAIITAQQREISEMTKQLGKTGTGGMHGPTM
ncbi:MAG: hypothetical protein QOG15_3764 [Solirubrobacteraceae bacterium]|jgi:uncharacterized protein (DUF305 family)|nr:hypothetical protein [Solirubrobacteraceae bacterium]